MGSPGKNGVGGGGYDFSFKILWIGDSGVGKSSLLMTFISDSVAHHLSPHIRWTGEVRDVDEFLLQGSTRILSDKWAKEAEFYSTNLECIKILVRNKVDKESAREVTTQKGTDLARQHKCSFLECNARTRDNVQQCFKELIHNMMEVPSLSEEGSVTVTKQILRQKQLPEPHRKSSCCS